jgi:rRNA maturation endonuclease Nob1
MFLKLSAIIMDQKLILSKKTECRKSRYPNLLYNSFNIQNVNIAQNLKSKYITFKKIIFVETDYSIFP